MSIYEQVARALCGPRGVRVTYSWGQQASTKPTSRFPQFNEEPTTPTTSKPFGLDVAAVAVAPDCQCPACQEPLTTYGVAGAVPTPNAFSICSACGEILVFDKDLKLKFPEMPDWERLAAKPKAEKALFEAQAQIRKT